MKYKTYLFKFLTFPDGKTPGADLFIKAQNQSDKTMNDDEVREAARAVAAEHIDVMKPLTANPGTLIKTAEEEMPTTYFRHEHYPGMVVWESNEAIRHVD